jgi:hypothetical protein
LMMAARYPFPAGSFRRRVEQRHTGPQCTHCVTGIAACGMCVRFLTRK